MLCGGIGIARIGTRIARIGIGMVCGGTGIE